MGGHALPREGLECGATAVWCATWCRVHGSYIIRLVEYILQPLTHNINNASARSSHMCKYCSRVAKLLPYTVRHWRTIAHDTCYMYACHIIHVSCTAYHIPYMPYVICCTCSMSPCYHDLSTLVNNERKSLRNTVLREHVGLARIRTSYMLSEANEGTLTLRIIP